MYNYVNSFDPPNNRKVLLVDRQKRNLRLSELTTRLGESRALNKAAAAKVTLLVLEWPRMTWDDFLQVLSFQPNLAETVDDGEQSWWMEWPKQQHRTGFKQDRKSTDLAGTFVSHT